MTGEKTPNLPHGWILREKCHNITIMFNFVLLLLMEKGVRRGEDINSSTRMDGEEKWKVPCWRSIVRPGSSRSPVSSE